MFYKKKIKINFKGTIYTEKITLKVIIYSFYDVEDSYYRQITNGFNEYSANNGLDINVKLTVLTPQTSSTVIENYGGTIESLLVKGSTKYDIYFYYSAYSKKYAEHFVNLKEYLPEENIKGYDDNLLKETCSSKDGKLVGLVMSIYK